jgi:hypothetical protein
MGTKQLKKIPYGISDYIEFRHGNYYYVDKTGYLVDLESAGKYLFFIRPRRFGKSLMLSMMATYYDVLNKDRFEELFKGTVGYNNPTEEQGKYLVLSLNFSSVDPSVNRLDGKSIRTFFPGTDSNAGHFIYRKIFSFF